MFLKNQDYIVICTDYMKLSIRDLARIAILVLLMTIAAVVLAQNPYISVSGIIKDAKSGDRISHASITLPGTSIGTVSNSDGEFMLKVDTSLHAESFQISHLSYKSKTVRIIDAIGKMKIYQLETQAIQLKEISIVPKDAREIVGKALENIRKNYQEVPNMMTGFYRESVKQNRDYLTISEAVLDIYKTSAMSMLNDQVKLFKGRKGTNVKRADTLMVQLQGGPNVTLLLDIVKNPHLSIGLNTPSNYSFEFLNVATIEGKLNWVIGFSPWNDRVAPLFSGKLYITQDEYAITRAEFSLDLSDIEKASWYFVQKKPSGVVFIPTATDYLVTYKQQNGKYYLNYVRIELKFKCDWKKRLFKNSYTLTSEMAITNRKDGEVSRFDGEDLFRSRMILSEKVEDLEDVNFWGENNIIEPESTIEDAIKKLSESMKK
jgi:hypothetical protein